MHTQLIKRIERYYKEYPEARGMIDEELNNILEKILSEITFGEEELMKMSQRR